MKKLPQLTLRDLFWLVALVAMGCGWWVRERQFRRDLQTEAGRSQHLANEIHLLQKEASFLRSKVFGMGGFGPSD
jgi:hypothetical protein